MVFSSYSFILLFLPIVFSVYFICGHFKLYSVAKLWLVLASFFFYSQGSPDFFPFFLGSVTANYVIGCALNSLSMAGKKAEGRIVLTLGVLANCGLLGYFKYTDFFLTNYGLITGTEVTLLHIVLPIGISFFTFQLIAFLVDSYRGETENYDVLDYLMFITFFPQLIVGPIVHHGEVVPQFSDKRNLHINWDNVALGLFIFALGCGKKMILADPLTADAQYFFNHVNPDMPMVTSWFHSIEYTVSYYFDLSGYADMAIGLGMMFNIVIPQNFNSPYRAKDFQEYWQKWHITLSRFLGAYIFRSVYKKGCKYRNYYIATMVTFFVSGFWHGAGWTFVVWGVLNGLLVCISSFRKRRWPNLKIPIVIGVGVTFLLAVLMRILFVSTTFTDAFNVFSGLFNFNNNGMVDFMALCTEKMHIPILCAVGLAICWFLPTTKTICEKYYKINLLSLLYSSGLLAACLCNMDKVTTFLYFQF